MYGDGNGEGGWSNCVPLLMRIDSMFGDDDGGGGHHNFLFDFFFFVFSSLIAASLFARIETQTPLNLFYLFFSSRTKHNFIDEGKRAKIYESIIFFSNRIFRRNTSRAMLLRARLGLI